MKRVLYSVLLILGMSAMFCSCEKEEGGVFGTDKIGTKDIIGNWALTDNNEIYYYWEFTKDGIVNYYELESPKGFRQVYHHNDTPAYYDNGTLFVPSSFEWSLEISGEYSVDNGHVYYDGTSIGSIERIGKDKYRFVSAILESGTVQKVKKFETYSIIGGKDLLEGKTWECDYFEYNFNNRIIDEWGYMPQTLRFNKGILEVDVWDVKEKKNYTINNDLIYFDNGDIVKILKLTKDNLVIQFLVRNDITADYEKKGWIYEQFRGEDIYTYENNWHEAWFWYYSGGKLIPLWCCDKGYYDTAFSCFH